MPMVIRNTPSARPLNGLVIDSTSVWYSVSAISRPARSAPMIGERPTSEVERAAAMTTSMVAARNSSGLFVCAAWAEQAAGAGACRRPAGQLRRCRRKAASRRGWDRRTCAATGPIAPRMKMIGTRAISSNRSIESAARPTGPCVPAMGSTSAVDERASARPRPNAPLMLRPVPSSTAGKQERRDAKLHGAKAEDEPSHVPQAGFERQLEADFEQ